MRGTIMSGTRPDDVRPGTELFVNGNRENSNNYLCDGIDNNTRLTLVIVMRPNVEAIREFKVQTNLFSAEQGRNPGGQVNVVTKSAGNEIHGAGYGFLRNDRFDANHFFANRAGQRKPPFKQHQFGGAIGGPIVKNKTFFFADYDGFRQEEFRVQEGVGLPFRAEAFNLFNHPQFDLPNDAVGAGNAGTITAIVGTPRQIQFGAKVAF